MKRYSQVIMRAPRVCLPVMLVMLTSISLLGCQEEAIEVAVEPTTLEGEQTREEPKDKRVFDSPLAGRWYEADPEKLASELDGYLAKASVPDLDNVAALILPHAGYRYSGQAAAYGIKAVAKQRFKRVIVLGPSHRVSMRNVASVPNATHYATPLGETPLDIEFIAKLKQYPHFHTLPQAHDGEHSVQIELPLLQHSLGDFRLVPIVVGQIDLETAQSMGEVLRGLMDAETLVVASSDFTHYGPNYNYLPFREDIPENIRKLDFGALEHIQTKDPEGFVKYLGETGATICGRHPIAILLSMLPDGMKAHTLHYDTSGNIGGDYENSVSYLSVAFTGQWPKGTPPANEPQAMAISLEDREALLRLARSTLTQYLMDGAVPKLELLDIELKPCMKTVRGAFVTLNKDGMLRGCIGEIYPSRPLYESVMSNALRAGLADRRFVPVNESELDDLCFEISALTPPRTVDSHEDIVLGKHGVVLTKEGRSAVFLPQVAPAQGWTLEETLSQLAMKAGLPAEAWREGASFSVFEAEVFSEDEG